MDTELCSLLEIGPGRFPLVTQFADGEYNWARFPDANYTAIQPSYAFKKYEFAGADSIVAPGYVFPNGLLTLPNVRFVDARAEDMNFPDESFDEVYAANVLSDQRTTYGTFDILAAAVRVLRPGAKLTMLDNISPQVAPKTTEIIARLGAQIELVVDVEAGDGREIDAVWQTHVEPYSYHLRHRDRTSRWPHDEGDMFRQFVKL